MFSGIGGFREGLTRAGGFECVGHCEIDKYANRSYNALFDTKGEWFIEDVKSDDDWVKLNDATVIMQDTPVLDIDKTDIAGNLLPGATLTIRDANDEVVDTWTTDYKTHSVPISDEFIKLSDGNKEYIYTLTEDAAPAGFEIANSVQFKLETVDDGISLFVRENADAEWTRADKRLIQMIDEATPREEPPRAHACSHTAADARCNPCAYTCAYAA